MGAKKPTVKTEESESGWKSVAIGVIVILGSYALYVNFQPQFLKMSSTTGDQPVSEVGNSIAKGGGAGFFLPLLKSTDAVKAPSKGKTEAFLSYEEAGANELAKAIMVTVDQPVLGDIPTTGATPLYGVKHDGGDAIFALACNYPKEYYQRFVGSLRKFGYNGDIVLAVSPPEKMKTGVGAYMKETKVVAYGFEVDCEGTDNCKLKDEFLGYPDPRPYRTFANIRYALYEYWMRQYSANSYILILDFRDTFFQGNPFGALGLVSARTPVYDLRMFAENYKVKSIGKCVFNSLWIGRCFGKEALKGLKKEAVICSGSTMGSYQSVHFYIKTMLKSMDSVKCWLKGIESDQGYQNYLFYNGHFNTESGNATLFYQGDGVVNTIGAMNGFRVPVEMKGPLDTFWKIRDADGFILNNDGTKSVCVHQWDRWYKDLVKFVDSKLYDKSTK